MKKGFTLIEIIAVIILLGTISLLIIPILTDSIKNSKQDLYDAQIKEIELAAEKWAYKNMDLLPNVEGDKKTITLLQLKQQGLFPLDVKDPRTGELIPNTTAIEITFKSNNYIYDVIEPVVEDSDDNYVDDKAPIMVLNGEALEYVQVGSRYEEKGALAQDSKGNSIDYIIIEYRLNGSEVASINTSTPNTYMVSYTAVVEVDGVTHATTINRTVIIKN